ncbi:MAG: type 4a pilus biogenesis protein PilO [Phycisphaeraceae bacterium]
MMTDRIDPGEWKRLALVAVLAVVLAVGVWLPAHHRRVALQERIAEARRELGRDLVDTRNLPELHRRVRKLHATLEGAQRYVPQEDEQDQLLRDLTEAMRAHAVVDPELVVHETRELAGYSVVPMRIEFRSSFPAAFGVLQRIESMSRLVRVDEFQLEPVRKERADSPLRVTLKLSTFLARGAAADDAQETET